MKMLLRIAAFAILLALGRNAVAQNIEAPLLDIRQLMAEVQKHQRELD